MNTYGYVGGNPIYSFDFYGLEQQFPDFLLILINYPLRNPDGTNAHPSSDGYLNQCAIRMGLALEKSGLNFASYPAVNKSSEGWPRSSKNLADWLWNEIEPPLIMSQSDFEKNHMNDTGLIYLAPPEGGVGHIDYWNKGNTGSGYYLASKVWFWPIK